MDQKSSGPIFNGKFPKNDVGVWQAGSGKSSGICQEFVFGDKQEISFTQKR